jgi:hypothetical protein
MEVKFRCSYLGCERTGLPSSGFYHAGWVDTVGARDQPLFVSNVASHGSGGEKTDVHSPPLINPGVGFESSLWLSWWHK